MLQAGCWSAVCRADDWMFTHPEYRWQSLQPEALCLLPGERITFFSHTPNMGDAAIYDHYMNWKHRNIDMSNFTSKSAKDGQRGRNDLKLLSN